MHAHAYTLKHFGALLQPKDIQGLVNEVEEELARENATQSARSARPRDYAVFIMFTYSAKRKVRITNTATRNWSAPLVQHPF